ncbi:Uncharacterised protein [Actinomyces viscosus]|uniref:Uncharacterized protein n=1 Tax=Actinomyces viscosus TaxID=1656 RepID=A0A448PM34_ACTVI|nr:Uncharacterised protein [Actinomyces viscosus]
MPDERTEPDQDHHSVPSDQGNSASAGEAGDGSRWKAELGDDHTTDTCPRSESSHEQEGGNQESLADEPKFQSSTISDAQASPTEEPSKLPRKSPDRLFRGCLVVIIAVIVGMVGIWMAFVRIDASLHPQAGPADRAHARRIAQAAADHLSHSPLVTSTPSASSEASTPSDISARVTISLKDGTTAQQAADLLASTHEAALHTRGGVQKITLTVSMSWTLEDTSIAADFDASRATTDIVSSTTRALTPVGEAKTIRRGGSSALEIDYGEVGAPPTSLTSPSGSRTRKLFTMADWQVTSTSNEDGQFAAPPIEQVITASSQTSATGSIELEATPGSMSVTGVATDDGGLTADAAAPVVHAVADCHAAGLSELNLNTTASYDDPWRTLVCKGGTWAPKDDGRIGQQEADILQKAAQL